MDEYTSALAERDFLDRQIGEQFVVDCPSKAEWAIKKIRNIRKLAQICIEASQEAIKAYKDDIEATERRRDAETAYIEAMLQSWFDTVPHKVSKTQESVKLPAGTIARKSGGWDFKREEDRLGTFLYLNGYNEYFTFSPKWGELKKKIDVTETGAVVDKETGTIIEGVTAEKQPDRFVVKEKDDED